MNVVLSNKHHPEYGVVTIPLPIPDEEYKHCMKLLEPLEIGDVLAQDCKVEKIDGGWWALDALAGTQANIDELDYLAKRLDSFCGDEDAQFEAMAYLLELRDVTDLINLTFCCQQATVISNFGNLEQAGKDHYLTIHGGSAPVEEVDKQDGVKIARELIAGGTGKVTPFGLVFDNGMKLEQVYTGREFPPYCHALSALDATVSPVGSDACKAFLQLPAPVERIDRMLQRDGFSEGEEFSIDLEVELCPKEVIETLNESDLKNADGDMLVDLNRLARLITAMKPEELVKLAAVALFVEPEYPFQILHLAERLDLFDFAPGVSSPEEYGRYMIEESGHFEYDPNLDEYYDFAKYGNDHIARAEGQFNARGYVAYQGTLSFADLMAAEPWQHQMGAPKMEASW